MEFIRMVNSEHQFQVLTEEASERSQLAKVKSENCKVQRINAALVKISAVLGGMTIITLIINA